MTHFSFKADLDARLDDLLARNLVDGLHAVIVIRQGTTLLERYFEGPDSAWARRLGNVTFDTKTLHDMRSVTKSILGLVYGIALEAGLVPPPEAPLLAQFPQYPDLAADSARRRLTIGHALTMTLGLEWNENIPYTSRENSEIAMELAPDRIRFVLERKFVSEPGRYWLYGGGAPALLGDIIARGAGQRFEDYTRSVLFDPLDIADHDWNRGHDGAASAASGLRLTPRGLARIGEMLVQGGRWNGRQIVPVDWLGASWRPAAIVDDMRHYGYLWYLGEAALSSQVGLRGVKWASAVGNGGQRLFVFPEPELVLAISAGNYDTPDQWRTPTTVLRELILGNLLG